MRSIALLPLLVMSVVAHAGTMTVVDATRGKPVISLDEGHVNDYSMERKASIIIAQTPGRADDCDTIYMTNSQGRLYRLVQRAQTGNRENRCFNPQKGRGALTSILTGLTGNLGVLARIGALAKVTRDLNESFALVILCQENLPESDRTSCRGLEKAARNILATLGEP